MNTISIVIPTLKRNRAEAVAGIAQATAMTPTELVVSVDPKRTGFTRTVNRGIRMASPGNDICLLNDDVRLFHYGWLWTLRRALYQNAPNAVVGPSGGSNTSPMRHGVLGDWGLESVKHIPYWCVLIRRSVLDQYGLLDERFTHYASDNYHCDMLRRKGLRVVWVKDVWVRHDKHGSGQQNKWKRADQALYKRLRKKR